MSEQRIQWYKGTLDEAAKKASADKKKLVICLFKDNEQKTDVEQSVTAPSLLSLLASRCVVMYLLEGAKDQKSLSQVFPISSFPSALLIHSSGTKALSGEDFTEENVERFIRNTVDGADNDGAVSTPSTPTSMGPGKDEDALDWQAREAERLRKKLAKQRAKDAVYIKQLRENIKDDRETYRYIHGQTPSAGISSRSSAVSLAADSAGGAESGVKGCRLLFRADGGQAISGDFAPEATLAEVRVFLERKLGLRKDNIQVCRTLPRVVLGSDNDEKTLRELQLVPSATLFLRFSGRPPSNQQVNSGLSLRPLVLVLALVVLLLAAWASRTKSNQFALHSSKQIPWTKKTYGQRQPWNPRRANYNEFLY